MSATHLHLLLNHLPVLGSLFGWGIFAAALLRKSEEMKKAALGLFVISAVVALPVFFTGEPAEEAVKALPAVSEALIERHEESAVVALAAVEILGALSLAGLFSFRKRGVLPGSMATAVFVSALLTAVLMARTANLGGQIRHSEIRAESVSQESNVPYRETEEGSAFRDH